MCYKSILGLWQGCKYVSTFYKLVLSKKKKKTQKELMGHTLWFILFKNLKKEALVLYSFLSFYSCISKCASVTALCITCIILNLLKYYPFICQQNFPYKKCQQKLSYKKNVRQNCFIKKTSRNFLVEKNCLKRKRKTKSY